MTPGYGDSYTVWCSPDPGTIEWPFIFKGGYIDKAFVKVRYQDAQGVWWPVAIDPKKNFKDENTLTITPVIPPCAMVDIYRDTTKSHPIVIYGKGGMLLRSETRNAAIRQAMHVVVELKDLAQRSDLECLCECADGGSA